MTGKDATQPSTGAPRRSGDGWALGPNGTKVWGLYGAAGLFLVTQESQPHVLLQHRAAWTNQGDTWGIPGGAVDAEETAEQGALRETSEECGIDPQVPRVLRSLTTAGPFAGDDWTYTTVIAHCSHRLETQANEESYELRWVDLEILRQVAAGKPEPENMTLLPPFKKSLPQIFKALDAK